MGMRRSFKPTNLIGNGDFSKGTMEWSGYRGAISVMNNTLTSTGDGSFSYAGAWQAGIPYATGKKIYVRFSGKVTSNDCSRITFWILATGMTGQELTLQTTPTNGATYNNGAIATLPAGGNGNLTFYCCHHYADAATAKGKVMEVQNVIAVDLTAVFGAGNEPSQAWCDLNIPNWFDGTLSGGVMGSIGGFK